MDTLWVGVAFVIFIAIIRRLLSRFLAQISESVARISFLASEVVFIERVFSQLIRQQLARNIIVSSTRLIGNNLNVTGVSQLQHSNELSARVVRLCSSKYDLRAFLYDLIRFLFGESAQ